MLVVCALALVAAAAVSLVVGLVGGEVEDLHRSMVLCVASLVVLAAAGRLERPRSGAGGASVGDSPPAGAAASAVALGDDDAPERIGLTEPLVAVTDEPFAPVPEADPQVAVAADEVDPDEEGGPFFPIADYDDLDATQILPLVPRLFPEEVPVVAARERATRARAAVLDALAAAEADIPVAAGARAGSA